MMLAMGFLAEEKTGQESSEGAARERESSEGAAWERGLKMILKMAANSMDPIIYLWALHYNKLFIVLNSIRQ